jgi:L-malate glycosyltransferase
MKPLKILYLMDSYIGPVAGTELQLLELIENLDPIKFQTHLAVFRETQYQREQAFPCPVTVLNIGKLASPRAVYGLSRLTRFIRKSGFELVHILFNDAAVAAPLFCKMGGARVIVSRRDMGFWYHRLNLAALRVSNRFVDRIVTNSLAVKENVRLKEGFPKDKIEVIYNGHGVERFAAAPSPDFRQSLGIGPNDRVIGMVANLYKIKRQSDLIEAFAKLKDRFPDLHVVFVGEGDEQDALMGRVQSLCLQGRVHFLGRLHEAIPIIKHFTVGVLCSESEGLANAILEYMGCGKPTICTNVGGNPEVVNEGENGFMVRVGDINALADRINRVLSDPSLAGRLGEMGRRRVAEDFSSQKMVDSYSRLYEEMT